MISFTNARSLLRLIALLAFATAMRAQSPAAAALANAPLRFGAAWYPEQWPESRWDADLALMEAAHFNVVRIGEFAWSTLEPAEGRYDLDWMDRAIALAAKRHIAVVIGTPTDAPPAWLTAKYPETLGVNADGRRRVHGNRRQFNYADPKYRELCRDIVRRLAQRFGHNPNVIGWQIGNEYTDESFDAATQTQFQAFLRAKYRTLADLNARWTTAYWSQTYTAWSQITLPTGRANPGLLLEHKHFVTATWRSFQQNQIDALRPLIAPTQFITTNIGGLAWSDNWDHYAITAPLDIASWDDYVGQGHLDATKNAMLSDFVRGWKRRNFWVMETEPGSVNWAGVNNALDKGETRTLAWQAVGHGADAILYWQWRSALNGQEQYHGTIVGSDGTPLPIYDEIAQIGREFELTSDALRNTTPLADTALLLDYDSRWAIDFQPHTLAYDQQQVLERFYAPLQRHAEATGQAVDIIDPTQPGSLDQYRVLVAPSFNVIDDTLASKLLAWVRNGGTLVLGPRSGMKDGYDALDVQRQPGPLAEALGARVDQFYALDHPTRVRRASRGSNAPPMDGRADTWAESLEITNPATSSLLSYVDPSAWFNNAGALVERHLGEGRIYYLGTLPDKRTLEAVLPTSPTTSRFVADGFLNRPGTRGSDPIELCMRADPGNPRRRVYIAINHSNANASITLNQPLRNLLPNTTIVEVRHTADTVSRNNSGLRFVPHLTELTLPPFGVAVLVPQETIP